MSHSKTETLVVRHNTSADHPFLANSAGGVFQPTIWLRGIIQDLPEGAEVHLVLRVLSEPDVDGWHDATVRTPQPGVFVEIRLNSGATEIGRIIDDIWLGEGDRVIFSPVAAWRETQ